jgi:hypothetical protein
MHVINFTEEQIEIGINYCKSKFIDGISLYRMLQYYDIPLSWYNERKVEYLEELDLFEDTNELTNNYFKCDLEDLIKTGTYNGLSVYIFELLNYIQKI